VTAIRDCFSKYSYLLIILFAIVIIAAAGYAFEQQQKRIAIEEARLDLATIADLKASQIVAWRRERLIDATSLYYNSMLAHRIKEHLKGSEKTAVLKELQTWMERFRSAGGHNKVLLFGPDAELITSASFDSTPPKDHYLTQVKQAVQTREIIFSDLHYDANTDKIDLELIIPLISRENGRNSCIAVLLIDIDPYKYLYPLIRTWTFPSFSGETLLVRRDGNNALFLNNLRFKADSALKLRVPLNNTQMPAVRAVLGQEGIFYGIDYRGVPVCAAIRTIPDSNWAIITKIDTQEILEPVTKRLWYVVATCTIISIAFSMGLSLWWRRKREAFLYKQYETEVEFNHELKLAEQSLQEANNLLEERVFNRTEELSESNTRLKQEIAERKQVEELLRKQFQAILQSPVAIIITDLEGSIEFVNPKFSEYCGYSYEEAIGQNPSILKSDKTPPEVYKRLWEAITAGNVWKGELCNRKKSGELYWEYAKILPLKNQEGIITNFMAFKEDITKRKQLEDKLLRSRKLETIGQIAGGVAHEVRNPLNAILSISEALFKENEIANNPDLEPYIQHIRTQVKRLAHLMNDLLDLGKTIPTSSIHPIPLNEVCLEAIELWNSSGLSTKIPVILEVVPAPLIPNVMADRGRLVQVIFNLLENAAQHSPDDAEIIMRLIRPDTCDPLKPIWIIKITDTGSGIPSEYLDQVFDPFYTGRRGGTGLGLALVKHFIEDMGGSVVLFNNNPPPGCSAEVHIPIAREKQA
jgi:PAS domain S-box-containing protein